MWRTTMRLLPNEHLCFRCADLTLSVLHCPADPALIRSDNTVRNEISTIGLQSLSSYSKGLLKHSAALPLSPSSSPFFCFPSSISPLLLRLLLFSLPSLSPYYSPLFIFCAGETRAWMPHTVSESPALRQHYCYQIFSIWNESLGRFFSSRGRKQWWSCTLIALFISLVFALLSILFCSEFTVFEKRPWLLWSHGFF